MYQKAYKRFPFPPCKIIPKENIILLFTSLLSLCISFHLPLHFINIRYKDSNTSISLIIFGVAITQLFTTNSKFIFSVSIWQSCMLSFKKKNQKPKLMLILIQIYEEQHKYIPLLIIEYIYFLYDCTRYT